jgi:ankyrin repeat protein
MEAKMKSMKKYFYLRDIDLQLRKAIIAKNEELSLELITNGANPDIDVDDGVPLIFYAIDMGVVVVKKILNTVPSLINIKDKNGNTVTHKAAQINNIDLLKFFIEKGASIESVNNNNKNPVDIAKQNNNVEAIKLFNSQMDILLFKAIFSKDEQAAIKYIGLVADLNAADSDGTPFIFHALIDQKIFEAFVKKGANLKCKDADGTILLFEAIEADTHKYNFLKDKSDLTGSKSVLIATKAKDTLFMVDELGRNCLHKAAELGNTELMKFFINSGVDLESKDKKGNTPLHIATLNKHFEAVSVLIKASADVNAKNNIGDTPKHIAAEKGDTDSLKALWHKDNSLEIMNKIGFTPLHSASLYCKRNTIEFLLSKGVNINIKGNLGETPLHLAAQVGSVKLIDLLCTKKANIEESDTRGFTPLHYAVMKNKKESVDALIKRGANKEILINDYNVVKFAEFLKKSGYNIDPNIIESLKEPIKAVIDDRPYYCQEYSEDWMRTSLDSSKSDEALDIKMGLLGKENPDFIN